MPQNWQNDLRSEKKQKNFSRDKPTLKIFHILTKPNQPRQRYRPMSFPLWKLITKTRWKVQYTPSPTPIVDTAEKQRPSCIHKNPGSPKPKSHSIFNSKAFQMYYISRVQRQHNFSSLTLFISILFDNKTRINPILIEPLKKTAATLKY